jgi:outer membrane biosynthesis protein TonB
MNPVSRPKLIMSAVTLLLLLSLWGLTQTTPVTAGITPTPTETPTPIPSPTDTPMPTPTDTPTLPPTDTPVTQEPGPQPSPAPTETPTSIPMLPESGVAVPTSLPLLGCFLLFILGGLVLSRRRL